MNPQLKTKVEASLKPLLDQRSVFGCALVSDGWSDTCFRPLLNALVALPDGTVFLAATDTSGETKDAAYLARFLGEHIKKLGKDTVVAVITDSASANKAAGDLLEKEFPHLWCVIVCQFE